MGRCIKFPISTSNNFKYMTIIEYSFTPNHFLWSTQSDNLEREIKKYHLHHLLLCVFCSCHISPHRLFPYLKRSTDTSVMVFLLCTSSIFISPISYLYFLTSYFCIWDTLYYARHLFYCCYDMLFDRIYAQQSVRKVYPRLYQFPYSSKFQNF